MKRIAHAARRCSRARGSGRARTPAMRLTLDEAIARGAANSHRLAELQARKAGGRRRRRRGAPPHRCRRLRWRGLHADESRRRVRHRAAGPAPAHHLSRRAGQLSRAHRSATGRSTRAAAPTRSSARRGRSGSGRRGSDGGAADLRLEIARAFWALVTATETEHVLARSLDSMAAHVAICAAASIRG